MIVPLIYVLIYGPAILFIPGFWIGLLAANLTVGGVTVGIMFYVMQSN